MVETIPISKLRFPIICLGGSAGGLNAYRCILECLPVDSGFAVVLVSHRGADVTHLLLRLLALSTTMLVVEASDGMQLRPNCVFLCPPRMEITTDGVILNMRARTKVDGWPNIVDIFLTSLADSSACGSVAVILSGTGYDGSGALRAIKKAGGLTFAQSDASYDDMPQAAVDTGFIDFILTAAEIGGHLAKMAGTRTARSLRPS